MRNTPANDIDTYLASLPADSRKALESLRKIIRSVAPGAVETISYQMPCFKYKGRVLVYFAAFKDHLSFFPGAVAVEKYAEDLKEFKTSKGTIRFTIEKPIPKEVVENIVKENIKDIESKKGKKSK